MSLVGGTGLSHADATLSGADCSPNALRESYGPDHSNMFLPAGSYVVNGWIQSVLAPSAAGGAAGSAKIEVLIAKTLDSQTLSFSQHTLTSAPSDTMVEFMPFVLDQPTLVTAYTTAIATTCGRAAITGGGLSFLKVG